MSDPKSEFETTPVDDVRRVRERLSREAGGDVRELVKESNRLFEEYREKLGLKVVPVPPKQTPRTGSSA